MQGLELQCLQGIEWSAAAPTIDTVLVERNDAGSVAESGLLLKSEKRDYRFVVFFFLILFYFISKF